MTTQNITLSNQQQNINVGFGIKQFKVENPSAFQVYVNASSSIPTRENAQFTVQPNSIFTSPPINSNVLTIYASGLDVTRGVPKITFTDSEGSLGQTSNTPISTTQFVGSLPNYPYTIISPTGQHQLPDITVDKFQNIFIQLSVDEDSSQGCTLLGGLSLVSGAFPLGGYLQRGGVIPYTPPSIPHTFTPFIEVFNTGVPHSNFVFNAIQTSDIFEETYNPPVFDWGIAVSGTFTMHYFTHAPGFMLSLDEISNSAGVIDFTIDIAVQPFLKTGNFTPIFSYRFINTNLALTVYNVITSKLLLYAGLAFVRVKFTNNGALAVGGSINLALL